MVRLYLTGTLAAQVYARCQDQTNGTDLTVWYSGTQIDADVETLTSSKVSVWFKLQASIGTSSTDTNYTLVCGNTAPTIKQVWTNIYPLADDFLGTSLDVTKWDTWNSPGITVAGSVITIAWSNPVNHSQSILRSLALFGNGYILRGRGIMPWSGSGQQRFCIHNGDSDEQGGLRHQSVIMVSDGWTSTNTPNTGSAYEAMSFNDTGAWGVASPALISADSSYHMFNIGRDSNGYVYGWIDEGTAVHTTSYPVSLPGWAYMGPYGGSAAGYASAGNPTQSWDWLKMRVFVPGEPVVTMGTPTYYPAPRGVFCG